MSRLLRSVCAIFMPPFSGLALVVVLFVVWAHLIFPHNDVIRGNLPDPDDYMYLDQVLDWIKGQGWFDNFQHRLDPPAGTPIPFSRLAQLPMALGILLFELFGLKPHGSAMVFALIYPCVLLGIFLVSVRALSSCVVPKRWAGASAYVTLFCVGLLFEFMPGHVDHHGLMIILVITALFFASQLMTLEIDHERDRAAISAGLILALAMTIALECLPWVLLISVYLGLWSLVKEKKHSKSALLFALSYLVGSMLGLLTTRPMSQVAETDILSYSSTYVWLALAITVPFLGAWCAARASAGVKICVGLILAVLSAELFLRTFPDLMRGPYGAIDPQLVPILLDNVQEALPVISAPDGSVHIRNLMGMAFMAVPASAYFLYRARAAEKWVWGLITLVLISALSMTLFYQYRFLGMTAAISVVPLTALLFHGWAYARYTFQGRAKIYAELALLLLVGPLPSVIVPALFDSRSFNVGMLLFPVDSGHSPCDMAKLEHVLRDPSRLGEKNHLIVSPMELGPELLFRTDHRVLSAPFHMDVQGNVDAVRFFSTSFPDEAKHIAHARGIDLVVACRAVPNIYLAPSGQAPALMERLFKGQPPPWLEKVPAPELDDFVLYRVHAD